MKIYYTQERFTVAKKIFVSLNLFVLTSTSLIVLDSNAGWFDWFSSKTENTASKIDMNLPDNGNEDKQINNTQITNSDNNTVIVDNKHIQALKQAMEPWEKAKIVKSSVDTS